MNCPQCTDRTAPMGALGRTKAYRCRSCGWTWTHLSKPRRKPTTQPKER